MTTSLAMIAAVIALSTLGAAPPATPSTPRSAGNKTAAPQLPLDAPPAQLLERARAADQGLDYDGVIPLAQAVLSSTTAGPEQRSEAYWLLGSALAVKGDDVEAGKAFRFLVLGRNDFVPDDGTPPKILTVFVAVRAEILAAQREAHDLEARRVFQALAPRAVIATDARGGAPLPIVVETSAPQPRVASVALRYRTATDAAATAFSSLALDSVDDGRRWSAVLPGELTANDAGARLEWFVEVTDVEGATIGRLCAPETPCTTSLTPGELEVPLFDNGWFWLASGTAVAVTLVAGAVIGGLALAQATALPDSELGTVHFDN